MHPRSNLGAWIKEQGQALGFDRVGIAPATDFPELAFFPEWQARGYAGALDYLGNPKRADVRRLFPEARSVICCALAYDTDRPRSTEVPPDPERGWVSRYAWGDDYHAVVEKKLEALREAIAEKLRESSQVRTDTPRGGSLGAQNEMKFPSTEPPGSCLGEVHPGHAPGLSEGFECRLYVDTGPVLERVYGKYAGLGWQAKNTCLLDAELGSFFFLGVLVTNLELAPDAPQPDGCGSCTLCLEACPTGALVEPYVLDARRCLSYLTIELRDTIPEEFRQPMGRHVFGCDICQDVCPYNRRAWVTDLAAFQPRRVETRKPKNENRDPVSSEPIDQYELSSSGKKDHTEPRGSRLGEGSATEGIPVTEPESLFHPRLDWLASLSEDEFRQVFRNSPVKRAKWRGLLRNTLVAMGNSGNPRFRPLLEKFVASEDSLLAEHAKWALEQLATRKMKREVRK